MRSLLLTDSPAVALALHIIQNRHHVRTAKASEFHQITRPSQTNSGNDYCAHWYALCVLLSTPSNPANGQLFLHKVLFKFRPEVSEEHKKKFVTELKTLKSLPCVKEQRLVVGGPSITDPIERSKGFHFALLSFHEDRAALDAYQASDEHHR